eukprot:3584323-Rhodomonas_salina.2
MMPQKLSVSVPFSFSLFPRHRAASNGHVATAKELINAGAEIDAEADNGDTPLKLAAGKVRNEEEDARGEV